MSGFFEIEQGKRYYCELLGNEDSLAGTFAITDGDIRLSLVRFDQFFHVDDQQILTVRTEGNWIASMFDTVASGSGERGGRESSTHYHEIVSNTTVIGQDTWTEADRIKRVSFRVPGADSLFSYSPVFQQAADAKMGSVDTELFSAPTPREEVTGWLLLSGGLSSRTPNLVEPWITIAFSECQTLDEMRLAVTRVVRFLACLSGVPLTAEAVTISRYSMEEFQDRVDKREPVYDHSVYYYHHTADRSPARIEVFHALGSLRDGSCRASFEAALSAWITRGDEWSPATALMMEALRLDGVMSADRLLTATRWLDDTPGAQALGAIQKDHVKALANLIGKWGKILGYGGLVGRLKNSLALVALESNRQRFERLISEIRAAFGHRIVGDDMVTWLLEAMKFRGPAAHGARTGLDEDYLVFSRAVYALECFDVLTNPSSRLR